MNCWKPKSQDMVISSQALMVREGSETISKESRSVKLDGPKRIASFFKDDDIVHPIRKLVDKCNQLVVGSNPTPGASQNSCSLKAPYHTVFLVYIRGFFVLIQGSEIRNSTIGVFLVVQNFQISQMLFERDLTLYLR